MITEEKLKSFSDEQRLLLKQDDGMSEHVGSVNSEIEMSPLVNVTMIDINGERSSLDGVTMRDALLLLHNTKEVFIFMISPAIAATMKKYEEYIQHSEDPEAES